MCERPDIAWIRKNVPVLAVGKALGLPIHHRRAKCWRPENHTHGDAEPSLYFYEKGNRVRCFVCDMRGGHYNIDLVMKVLDISFADAVNWIAQRFAVPEAKRGRPIGSHPQPNPYRVGVSGSDFEVLVRSGTFGQFSPAERSILSTLLGIKDAETGITRLSYRAIMRYAGVGSRANVSNALKFLQKVHAVQISRGSRIGVIRECNTYRVTLEDPKFLEHCNAVYRATREEIDRERNYRRELRAARAKAASRSNPKNRKEAEESKDTCEGLNLSSISELNSNKAVPIQNREIGVLVETENLHDALWMIRAREAMNRQAPEPQLCD